MEAQIVLDPKVAEMMKDILSDEEGFAIVQSESTGSRPEDLVERLMAEVSEYKRYNSSDYEGLYRGHRFRIGWEIVTQPTSVEDEIFGALFGVPRVRKQTRTMVLRMADKPGGYPTGGIRLTDEFEGPLSDSLHALYTLAGQLFDRAELQRLMNTPHEDGEEGLENAMTDLLTAISDLSNLSNNRFKE